MDIFGFVVPGVAVVFVIAVIIIIVRAIDNRNK